MSESALWATKGGWRPCCVLPADGATVLTAAKSSALLVIKVGTVDPNMGRPPDVSVAVCTYLDWR
jgi:hypothetical protein